jgi:small subunit ribosomal protein S6
MNSYELMVIFTPVLSQEEFNAGIKNLKKFITDNSGEIVGEDTWGLKSFAYPIEKKTTGLYYVMEFNVDPTVIAKMTIQMNRDESIMRHMTTVLDKHALAYNDRKRKGIKIEPKTNSVTEKEEA